MHLARLLASNKITHWALSIHAQTSYKGANGCVSKGATCHAPQSHHTKYQSSSVVIMISQKNCHPTKVQMDVYQRGMIYCSSKSSQQIRSEYDLPNECHHTKDHSNSVVIIMISQKTEITIRKGKKKSKKQQHRSDTCTNAPNVDSCTSI